MYFFFELLRRLRIRSAEHIRRGLLPTKNIAHHWNPPLLHQARHQRHGVLMKNGGRHSDGHTLGPIEWRHVRGTRTESEILTLVLRGQVCAAIYEELNHLI